MKFLRRMKQKEIFHIDNANHVVAVSLVDRDTGKTLRTEDLKKLFVGAVNVCTDHIHAGDHDVLGGGVAEIKHVVDHLPLVALDDSVFMAHIHNCAELMLSHKAGLGIGVYMEEF